MYLSYLPLFVQFAFAQQGRPGYGHGWDRWGHMMPYGGIFFWGLILIAVVVLITVLARKGGKDSEGSSFTQETALDILKKRYARGELTKDEFERMKQEIQ